MMTEKELVTNHDYLSNRGRVKAVSNMLTHAAKTHSLDNGGEHALLFLMNTKDVQVGNKLKFKSWCLGIKTRMVIKY